jgi:hypothetical protein
MSTLLLTPARTRVATALLAIGASLLSANAAYAQCRGWTDGFGYPTVDGEIYAAAFFDDGSGSALYLGGNIRAAGEIRNQNLLRWDGTSFSVPGGGVNGPVSVLRAYLGRLYVGGKFNSAGGNAVRNVASWGPGGWQELGGGTNGPVYSIVLQNEIIVGGAFDEAGGVAVNNVATWSGFGWSALAAGVDNAVLSLIVYQDALVAGGLFRNAGGAPADRIARWDAGAWSPLGSGANAAVRALLVNQTQTGVDLLVGGDFTSIGGMSANRIASWNGTAYSAIGAGFDRSVRTIQTANLDGNVRIIVGGFFEHSGAAEVEYASWWDGTAWQQLGTQLDGLVHTIAIAPPAPVQAIFAGTSSLDALQQLAGVNGTWRPIVSGGGGLNGEVRAMLRTIENDDAVVYVGGNFRNAGGTSANNIARWDGVTWTPLADGIAGTISALAEHDDGAGGLVVAAAETPDGAVTVASWNGSSWTPLGGPLFGSPTSLASYSGELYVGGTFRNAAGDALQTVQKLVSGNWVGVGGMAVPGCMTVLEEGGFPFLFAGADGLFRLTGPSFARVGEALDGTIHTLGKFDLGDGIRLYAGGSFRKTVGGRLLGNVVRMENDVWQQFGGGAGVPVGLLTEVLALGAFDDGHGPALVALGSFTDAGGTPVVNAARWDGQSWSSVAGIGWAPRAATALPGGAPGLLVAGSFNFAGNTGSSRLAVLGDVPLPADLDGDGDVDLQDLATLLANFSRSGDAEYEDGDIDGDRDVDLQDLGLLLANFGAACE